MDYVPPHPIPLHTLSLRWRNIDLLLVRVVVGALGVGVGPDTDGVGALGVGVGPVTDGVGPVAVVVGPVTDGVVLATVVTI